VESVVTHAVSPEAKFLEVPMFDIADRHILVTGGSSGFGRHFARFVAGKGAKVTLDGPLLLLVSNAGSFMTGSVVTVDGGHLVSGL